MPVNDSNPPDVPLESHMNSHSVYISPSLNDFKLPPSHVFFVTGNPGCIGYYHAFLYLLSQNLAGQNVHVYGSSLQNFVDNAGGCESSNFIMGLEGMIGCVEGKLLGYVHKQPDVLRISSKEMPCNVVLVGHSVGAYICMELLRRWKNRVKAQKGGKMQIIGCIGLFPTVTYIAESPSGRRFGFLASLPYSAKTVAHLARLLYAVLPARLLQRLIEAVTGFTTDASKVTTDLMGSIHGVEQALVMARDEMNYITEDRWDNDVWGGVESHEPRMPKLVFYFGRNDHWVANKFRDELIAARASCEGGASLGKPRMLIDDEDIPHSFSIHHNSIVANKTAGFIRDIILDNKGN